MKIYDCIQFFNEEHIFDLRINILNEFVDFFVVVESTCDHQGNPKKLNFDLNKFKKYENKIIYVVVDDTAEKIKKPHIGGHSLTEQHQRNSIMKGLKDSNDDDLIILSDVDEIPDLTKINEFNKKNKYAVFSQKAFAYKLNLFNSVENNWHGSKMCLRKDLKSPQWLRNLKFKKYPFWRIDKPRNMQIIQNGGWHFAYLLDSQGISKKIKSFAHGEDNKKENTDINIIENKMKKFFHPTKGFELKKIEIDSNFPRYIIENREKLKKWII